MLLFNCLLICFVIKTAGTLGFFGSGYHVNLFPKMRMKCLGYGFGFRFGYMPAECKEYRNDMHNMIDKGINDIMAKKKLFWKKLFTMPPMTTTMDEDMDDDMNMETDMETIMDMEPVEATSPLSYTDTVIQTEPEAKFSAKITEDCGKTMISPSSRVIGGHRAKEMEIPWQVGIQKIDSDIDDKTVYLIRGGGAIINKRWILTAAHVFNDVTLNETRGIYGTISAVNPRKTIKFDKLIIHQNYDMKTFMNDIALLRVDHDMQLFPNETTVNAICLPDRYKKYSGEATVAGWGVTDTDQHAESPEFLMSVGLKLLDDKVCKKLYPTFNSSVMLCAGELDGGKDSCDGDSGGPLFVYQQERGVIVGIVSFGQPRSCGKKDTAAAYTKVSQFLEWITSMVKDES